MVIEEKFARRIGPEHLRLRLERETDILEKKMVLGYWHIRLKDQKVFFRWLATALKLCGLWAWGRHNAHQYTLTRHRAAFPHLPPAFEGFRILHLSDLHIECMAQDGERLLAFLDGLEADVCVVTGDFRYENYGDHTASLRYMEKLIRRVKCSRGTLAVLGNHDPLELWPGLEAAGARVLMNESLCLEAGGDRVWIAGVDDPHYFKLHDLTRALDGIPPDGFTVLLAHSPEIAPLAADAGVDFYLCGHAHGGQICLPGEVPLIANLKFPRKFFRGDWTHGRLKGYTSRGTGASGLPVRFFSRPEVIVHELTRGKAED